MSYLTNFTSFKDHDSYQQALLAMTKGQENVPLVKSSWFSSNATNRAKMAEAVEKFLNYGQKHGYNQNQFDAIRANKLKARLKLDPQPLISNKALVAGVLAVGTVAAAVAAAGYYKNSMPADEGQCFADKCTPDEAPDTCLANFQSLVGKCHAEQECPANEECPLEPVLDQCMSESGMCLADLQSPEMSFPGLQSLVGKCFVPAEPVKAASSLELTDAECPADAAPKQVVTPPAADHNATNETVATPPASHNATNESVVTPPADHNATPGSGAVVVVEQNSGGMVVAEEQEWSLISPVLGGCATGATTLGYIGSAAGPAGAAVGAAAGCAAGAALEAITQTIFKGAAADAAARAVEAEANAVAVQQV